MKLVYQSTRNADLAYSASEAILTGIAPDGGLFVPSYIPQLPIDLDDLKDKSYQELALAILQAFLPDYTQSELESCIAVYGEKFDSESVTPLIKAGDLHYLELFHGPTIAFKDMALSVLPKLMTVAAQKNNLENDIVILTATSGDTGKAALVGFADVPQTHIIVFYPENGVSDIQERQMVTQKGENVHVVAIKGNFDDAQTKVKELFADAELRETLTENGLQFSSANSINIGRLVPQIIYYVYAYAQLLKYDELAVGDSMNVVVPTGNFGNILAAYYAKEMGLPIQKFIVASNENNVLTDFFQTGTYDRNRDFILTTSPSMDILVSSNLERLVYHLAGNNPALVRDYMEALSTKGLYQITTEMLDQAGEFHGNFATEAEVSARIREVAAESDYIIDPHTAVAAAVAKKYRAESGDDTVTVVASTASPYKFPEAVLAAIDPDFVKNNTEEALLRLKEHTNIPFPAAVNEALHDPIRHETVVTVDNMKDIVKDKLNIR